MRDCKCTGRLDGDFSVSFLAALAREGPVPGLDGPNRYPDPGYNRDAIVPIREFSCQTFAVA